MSRILSETRKCKYCRLPFIPSDPDMAQEFCSPHCRRLWRMELGKQEFYDAETRARLTPFECPWDRGPVMVDGQAVGIPDDWPFAPELVPQNVLHRRSAMSGAMLHIRLNGNRAAGEFFRPGLTWDRKEAIALEILGEGHPALSIR